MEDCNEVVNQGSNTITNVFIRTAGFCINVHIIVLISLFKLRDLSVKVSISLGISFLYIIELMVLIAVITLELCYEAIGSETPIILKDSGTHSRISGINVHQLYWEGVRLTWDKFVGVNYIRVKPIGIGIDKEKSIHKEKNTTDKETPIIDTSPNNSPTTSSPTTNSPSLYEYDNDGHRLFRYKKRLGFKQ